MIDITKSEVITYGNNEKITIYQDHDDANTWYLTPTPVIPIENGVPQFSLVQYDTNQGKAGTCSFETELQVPPAALAAVQKAKPGFTQGQFDWQAGGQVWFTFMLQDKTLELGAQPSSYGGNRASFIVQLPNADAVNDFINAFGPGGSAGGTFKIEYVVTALTKLPPASVTVTFNSNIAYTYSKTVKVDKNVWGHVTSRRVTINQYLNESQAGTVAIDDGGQPLSPDMKQKLTAWGNQTLADDVNQAVDQAINIIGEENADNFSLNMVASFKNVYSEEQVVPWYITPMATLPSFSQDQWDKLYSTVENQTLDVGFTVLNLLANGVEQVELTVTYPTRTTGNSHVFTSKTSGVWRFKADGSIVNGKYDPSYSYQYKVTYKDHSITPYTSPEIETSDTQVVLDTGDLSVLHVSFTAQNVFSSSSTADNKVESLNVSFNFVNQNGGAVHNQQFTLDSKTPSHTVKSFTKLPALNDYQYKLVYVLSGGQEATIDYQSDSSPSVMIDSPFQPVVVTPFVLVSDYQMIELMATYSDTVNDINEQKTWAIQPNKAGEQWTFLAPRNTIKQQIQYSGEIIDTKGNQITIPQTQTEMMFINVSETQQSFGVQVDPSQIQFDTNSITQVVLTLFTWTAQKTRTNITDPAFTFLKGAPGRLYSFHYNTGETPTYFWTADYWYKDGTKKTIKPTIEKGTSTLVLPANAP
jgi:hypothetical protein